MNALRRIMTSTVDDLEISNIFDLGMKTGSYRENGKIYIDEEKLREAIENNPEGVMKLFNNDSEGNLGIARQLQNELDKTMKSISERAGSSTNLYDQSTIGKTLKNIDDQIFRMEERLARMEDRYWKQFTAMEQALQAMYQQGDWLAQQMMIMGG
jgi:flagellar hook-associated protein 2